MAVESRGGGLRRASLTLFVSNFGTNLLGFASGVALAREVGPEGRGLYQTAAIYWAIVPGIACLSLSTLIAANGDQDTAPRWWYRNWGGAFLVLGLGVAAIMAFVGPFPRIIVLILALGVGGYMLSDLVQGRLRQLGRFRELARFRWIDMGGASVLVVLAFVFGALSVEVAVSALVGTTVVAVVYGSRYVDLQRCGRAPLTSTRDIGLIHSTTLIRICTSWADQFLVGWALGLSSLGIYAVASSLAAQFAIVPAALAVVSFRVAKADAEDRHGRLELIVASVVWLGLAAALCTWMFADSFFKVIFGAEFGAAGPVAALLVVSAGAGGVLLLIENALIAAGSTGAPLRARVIGAVIGLVFAVPILFLQPRLTNLAVIPVVVNMSACAVASAELRRRGALDSRRAILPPRWSDLRGLLRPGA